MWAVSKGAVEAVFHTVPPGIGLMNASASLIVAQVVLALCITSGPVQVRAARSSKTGEEFIRVSVIK